MTSGPPDPEPGGNLRPTGPNGLAAVGVAGLVCGWLAHPISVRLSGAAPLVGWPQALALLFVAAVLGAVAWSTWRTIHVHRQRIEPHRAVNRLVLARASAVAGVLTAGAYAGYAVSWLGVDAELAGQRIVRSLAAALSGVLMMVSALLLERACRVRSDDDSL